MLKSHSYMAHTTTQAFISIVWNQPGQRDILLMKQWSQCLNLTNRVELAAISFQLWTSFFHTVHMKSSSGCWRGWVCSSAAAKRFSTLDKKSSSFLLSTYTSVQPPSALPAWCTPVWVCTYAKGGSLYPPTKAKQNWNEISPSNTKFFC